MGVTTFDLTTHDPELAHQTLTEVYAGDRNVTITGSAEGFTFSMRSGQAGALGGDRVRHTMDARAVMDPFENFMAASVLGGAIHTDCHGSDRSLGRGDAICYSQDAEMRTHWTDIDVAMVRLPMAVVASVAAARIGDAELEFHDTAPLSRTTARRWGTVSRFVHRTLAETDSAANNTLVESRLAELVAAEALAAFPNTTMTIDYVPGHGTAGPAVVRRALAFVDANASRPITAREIAAAVGIGVRGLQAAFRRHLGTTPTAHLRRVRLEAARRELQQVPADAGVTVAAVAARWGFAHPARFSA